MGAPSKTAMNCEFDIALYAKGLAFYKLSESAGTVKTVVVDGVTYRADAANRKLLVLRNEVQGFVPVTRKGWVALGSGSVPLFCSLALLDGQLKAFAAPQKSLYAACSAIKYKQTYYVMAEPVPFGYQPRQYGCCIPFVTLQTAYPDNTHSLAVICAEIPAAAEFRSMLPSAVGAAMLDRDYFLEHEETETYPPAAFDVAIRGGQLPAYYAPSTRSNVDYDPPGNVREVRKTIPAGEDFVEVLLRVARYAASSTTVISAQKYGANEGELIALPGTVGTVWSSTDDELFVRKSVLASAAGTFLAAANAKAEEWAEGAEYRSVFGAPDERMRVGEFSNLSPTPESPLFPVMHVSARWVDGEGVRLVLHGYDAFSLMDTPLFADLRAVDTEKYYQYGDGYGMWGEYRSTCREVVVSDIAHNTGLKFHPPEATLICESYVNTLGCDGEPTLTARYIYDAGNGEIARTEWDAVGVKDSHTVTTATWRLYARSALVASAVSGVTNKYSTVDGVFTHAVTALEGGQAFSFIGGAANYPASVVARYASGGVVDLWAIVGGRAYKFPDSGGILAGDYAYPDGSAPYWGGEVKTTTYSVSNPPQAVDVAPPADLFATVVFKDTKTDKPPVIRFLRSTADYNVVAYKVAGTSCVVVGVALPDWAHGGDYKRDLHSTNPATHDLRVQRGECIVGMVVNLDTGDITSLKSLLGVDDNVFPYLSKGVPGDELTDAQVVDITALLSA